MVIGDKRKKNRKNKQNKKNKNNNELILLHNTNNKLINSNSLVNSNNNNNKNNNNNNNNKNGNGGGVNVMINQCYNILNGSFLFGSFFNKFDVLFNYLKSFLTIQKQSLNVNKLTDSNMTISQKDNITFSTNSNNSNNNSTNGNGNTPSIIIQQQQQQQHHHFNESQSLNNNNGSSLSSLGGSYITVDDLNDQLKIVQLEQKIVNLEKEIQRMRNEQNQMHKQNLNQYHELLKQIINAASLIQHQQPIPIIQQVAQPPQPFVAPPPPPPPPPPMVFKPKPIVVQPVSSSNNSLASKKSNGVPQFSISMADITGVKLRKTSSKFAQINSSPSRVNGSPARNRVVTSPAGIKKSPFKRVLTPVKKSAITTTTTTTTTTSSSSKNATTTTAKGSTSTPLKDITNSNNIKNSVLSPKSITKPLTPSNIIFSPLSNNNNNASPYKPLTISTLR
ncbi:hypothetical protein ACTFIR_011171 [Dictyostelium discoideum]